MLKNLLKRLEMSNQTRTWNYLKGSQPSHRIIILIYGRMGRVDVRFIAHIQCTIHISHSFWPKNKKISHGCYEPMIHPLQLYDLIYVPYVRALLVHPIIPWIYQQKKTYNTLRSFHFGWDLSITRHMVACAALSYMYMRVSYRYIYPT